MLSGNEGVNDNKTTTTLLGETIRSSQQPRLCQHCHHKSHIRCVLMDNLCRFISDSFSFCLSFMDVLNSILTESN
ncbi:CLUMA_CG002854, isoform A [Clunio marinus]|uniref:CLUMA_CG002854, isoform A n=1 Tax=Clunio marinus TaxID=568069 RepID=A0A1J1HLQ0_9DIPT|nr:CLUMA_CG002854, isoform A [Clunio marinus]